MHYGICANHLLGGVRTSKPLKNWEVLPRRNWTNHGAVLWCASTTHITLKVFCICRRKGDIKFIVKIFSSETWRRWRPWSLIETGAWTFKNIWFPSGNTEIKDVTYVRFQKRISQSQFSFHPLRTVMDITEIFGSKLWVLFNSFNLFLIVYSKIPEC